MINFNPVFNAIADEQGIEVGSKEWLEGGLQVYGGNTGSHAAYGWRHDHLVNEIYPRKVFANYCHRRAFYELTPEEIQNGFQDVRYPMGYEIAGRPIGWKKEDGLDLDNGQVAYLTSQGIMKVCGPDILHFHLGPLFSVYDANLPVKAQGKMISSKLLAEWVIKYLMSTLAGEIRGNKFSASVDRANANILHCAYHAAKRDLLLDDDKMTIHQWLIFNCLSFYESGVGHGIESKTAEAGKYKLQIYNGLYWVLPALYDLWASFPEALLKDRMGKIIKRFCQWILDLHEVMPSMNINQIYIPREMAEGSTPPETLKGSLSPESFIKGSTDWSLWGYRAVHVAATFLNSQPLFDACKAIYFKHAKNPANKIWLVDANGEYAKALAIQSDTSSSDPTPAAPLQ
ncbi:hypothetical protein E6Q11_02480 [Candidatus Dojkabacteria bacterium]|uniref:Uncharacterized protein n=1 Tax=Candidatus Dojkabacteria bacterium TaxID=2099670 RepID=A0A5C7J7R2_9BACT|nr:MAG: hypothetical protein E6Q11_02480 [Candidatus Dojkabacteria bacterium]